MKEGARTSTLAWLLNARWNKCVGCRSWNDWREICFLTFEHVHNWNDESPFLSAIISLHFKPKNKNLNAPYFSALDFCTHPHVFPNLLTLFPPWSTKACFYNIVQILHGNTCSYHMASKDLWHTNHMGHFYSVFYCSLVLLSPYLHGKKQPVHALIYIFVSP